MGLSAVLRTRVMHQDNPDKSASGDFRQLEGSGLSPSGPMGADVFGSGLRPTVLHEFRAVVVKDQQVLVGFDEIDAVAGEEPGDVEPGLSNLNDAGDGDRRAANSVPANGSYLVSRPGRVGFRGRLPSPKRGDPAGQSLMGSLGVVGLIEVVDLLLQLLERAGERLLVEEAEQGLVEAFVVALRRGLVGLAGDRLDAQSGDVGDELSDGRASTGSGRPRYRSATCQLNAKGTAHGANQRCEPHDDVELLTRVCGTSCLSDAG